MALPSVLRVCLVVGSFVLASATAKRLPIHAPTDGEKWYGNDGNWSTITLRLGTPAQYVYLLAETSSSITTTVDTLWCNDETSGYSCDERGRAFDIKKSSTWKGIGEYQIDLRPELTDTKYISTVMDYGFARFGRDKMKIKLEDNSVLEVNNRVIGVLNETTRLLGSLGLGVDSQSFKNEEAYPSFMSVLYDNGTIPSRSYGYTAGSYYRTERAPMDLVFGGKNLGRYSPNDVTFKLNGNKDPVMTLEDLQVSATGNPSWGAGSKSLLPNPVLAQIDSSTPYLWLPAEACQRFEDSLGLVWNETTSLYLLNDTVVQSMKALNISFSFTLAAAPGSDQKVDIVLPYSAMDLQTSWPFLNTTSFSNYFPLKRAVEKQITIGRTFLQEAYLIMDYERGNFSVHQALNPAELDNIVSIIHPKDVISSAPKKGGLGIGAIVGIAVAGVVVLIAIVGGLIYCCRKQKPAELENSVYEAPTVNGAWEIWTPWGPSKVRPPAEAGNDIPAEMSGEPAAPRAELAAVNQNPVELDGQLARQVASPVSTPSTTVATPITLAPSTAPTDGWSPMSPMSAPHEQQTMRY
ncbi:aspartic peptidase domain-containing protein [Geopyxis carbonaria]|nr:aspartic peptidase domain-containing protein [Geopyxis carbonaria]